MDLDNILTLPDLLRKTVEEITDDNWCRDVWYEWNTDDYRLQPVRACAVGRMAMVYARETGDNEFRPQGSIPSLYLDSGFDWGPGGYAGFASDYGAGNVGDIVNTNDTSRNADEAKERLRRLADRMEGIDG